jgi:hypothetical protein
MLSDRFVRRWSPLLEDCEAIFHERGALRSGKGVASSVELGVEACSGFRRAKALFLSVPLGRDGRIFFRRAIGRIEGEFRPRPHFGKELLDVFDGFMRERPRVREKIAHLSFEMDEDALTTVKIYVPAPTDHNRSWWTRVHPLFQRYADDLARWWGVPRMMLGIDFPRPPARPDLKVYLEFSAGDPRGIGSFSRKIQDLKSEGGVSLAYMVGLLARSRLEVVKWGVRLKGPGIASGIGKLYLGIRPAPCSLMKDILGVPGLSPREEKWFRSVITRGGKAGACLSYLCHGKDGWEFYLR